LLVRANEVVSNDRLIDELWGENPPETAATSLHGLVSQLRKALEPDRVARMPGEVLVTRAPGYLLRVGPRALDAREFERLLLEGRETLAEGDVARASETLRSALKLWRGQALTGIDDVPAVHAEASRLEELRAEALEDGIDADLALGRDRTLVPELEALVESEPLRERPHGQLMLALYRSGRQAEALEHYKEMRRTFVERLGIEPTPRLRELEQAMLAQDPELDVGLPRFRPPERLRRRSRRLVLPALALTAVAVATAGTVALLLTRGNDNAALAAPGTVAVVDAKTLRVVDSVRVGSEPVAIVYGHDSVWVANSEDGTVSRIDPKTRDVEATIGVPSPVDLAVGAHAIWVAGGIDGTVSRIDPDSNDVVATLDLRGADPLVPRTVNGIAAGAGGVWAAVAGKVLVRIDPERNRVVRSTDLGATPLAVASERGAVWAVTAAGRLLRIEPTTGVVTSELSVGPPGSFPTDVQTADDGVLVLVGAIWQVDRATTRLERTLDVGGFITAAVDAAGPGLWAVTANLTGEGDLIRFFDPALAKTPRNVQVGSAPTAVAVGAGAVWVAIGRRDV
jgi:YVTN family beta-propeller protein